MTKLNKNHYAIKLLKEMLPYGISGMQLGAITVTLQYPENNTDAYTLSLINAEIQKGVVFNILKHSVNTTVIASKVCEGEVLYEQATLIPSSNLFNN